MVSHITAARPVSSSIRFRGFASRKRSHNISNVTRYAIVALVCFLCDLFWPNRAGLGLSAALFLLWSLWLVNREMKAALLALNPVVCYQCWQVATLGLAPLYIVLSSEFGAGVSFGNYTLPLETVAYGHAVTVAGSWAFYAGMKRFQPREAPGESAGGWGAPGASLLIATAVGVAFQLRREVIASYVGSAVAQLLLLPLVVLCMVALNPPPALRRSAEVQLGVLLLGSAGLLLLSALRDSKMEVMFSFLPLAWWALYRNKRGLLAIIGLGLVVLYVGLIAPLVSHMRNSGAIDEKGIVRLLTPGFTEQAANSMREDYASDPRGYFETWADATLNRMCDPCAAAMAVTLAHDNGFLQGRGLEYVPMAFIPRVLWPGKPLIDRGRDFTTALGWAADASQATTSTGQTSAGELYWNFGWPGVLVGMYLLGAAISGVWWRAAGRDPRDGVLEMAAYTDAMLSFVLVTGSAAGVMFVGTISAGLFFRAAIALRDKIIRRKVSKSGGAKLGLRPLPLCE